MHKGSHTVMDDSPAVPAGVWCPVVTLYKDSPRQELDLEAMHTYFTHLISSGVNGLVLQGSTAEAALLLPEERVAITRTARKAAADLGVPKFPLAAGVSGQSTVETFRLLDDATEAGADFGLLLPPSYWPKAITNKDIVQFYREVADHSHIPIIVYNFPGVTAGIDLGVDVLSELAVHPNIAGVKLTCANAGKVSCLTARFRPSQFAVFSGQSDWLLPCLVAGGVGCVTGIGNVFPRAVAELYALWQAGRTAEARDLQGKVALAELACKKGLAATKCGAAHFIGRRLGLTAPATFYPRKPYSPASADLQAATLGMMGVLELFDLALPRQINSSVPKASSSSSKPRTHFTLNTGAEIPAVGFGTWKAAPGSAATAVGAAFEAGYRHFDCAPLYGNEAEIGDVFRAAAVPRAEYFVTTKLWSSDHRRASAALDTSLRDLGLDYVDLWLMHWPVTLPPGAEYGKEDRTVHDPDWDFCDTWREMERILKDGSGRVRAIGVANFSTVNLEKLLASNPAVVPAVNQTELQPLLPQAKLHRFCADRGIHQTAFGPLGGTGSTLHDEPAIVDIARARGVSTGNVMLSWGLAKGWSVIPKSVTPARITANLRDNFVLTDDEMKRIDELVVAGAKRFNRPNWGTTVFHDDADDVK
ncbi:NADP-dependent oxidoreductase domain-containing protein [Microdochium trichocladiopsis]|uniref:NADP-dependent oxidoreductase domain-containing protein n=1 Tax=Microdochium trichocladiopsis TaxID=1682393 RepID=A0A9P9BL97_9PEZI|nr:NADP-dependent oxidoreductase domain-containing protein [Microdochium trichocladiopsis]KAH7021477.1 NADP-dependent oxidoreductase domain-containing protein [Microdochium trichocladiopsis]